MSDSNATIGPVRAWALAAGGMVGGGIYISLGVVIEQAGKWAFLSFIIAGLAALITAYSYAKLSNEFGKAGGAFEFLEEMQRERTAGSLSWLLIIGYTLTISVYAYAFGHYVANSFDGGQWAIRALAVGIAALIIGLNLLGAGKLTLVEVIIVSTNLLALLVLAGFGMADWDWPALSQGVEAKSLPSALMGAAVIFVAYEGFQLLAYEYDELTKPKRYFVPVMVSAAAFVIACYVAVTFGATMILGAEQVVSSKQVALSDAAQKLFGQPGLIAMTVAAAFATSAAINSTLFSTAKLTARVADDGELPRWLEKRNANDIPDWPVIGIGAIAGLLSISGSLSSLVEAASLVFVVTFGIVNLVCAQKTGARSWIAWTGLGLCILIGAALLLHLVMDRPIPLAILAFLVFVAIFVRPRLISAQN